MLPHQTRKWELTTSLLLLASLLGSGLLASEKQAAVAVVLEWPSSGGPYQVEYLQSISKPSDLSIRRGFFSRLSDMILGASGRPKVLFRPFTIATDGQGRLLVVDTSTRAVHLLDQARNKHEVLLGPARQRFRSPIGLDTDASGNIYISDSLLGKIFVFDKNGRFRHFLGDIRGEGFFKRPTGLTVDRATNRLYLTDTLRHKIYVLDPQGKIEREWGKRGSGPGEFNFPTAVAVAEGRVFVLDAMNFRVQVFTPTGDYLSSFGSPVNEPGGFFRPKGLAVDAQNKLVFVVDAMFEVVQAFTFDGKLVMAFGHPGSGPGEFRLPAGICIQPDGRILVADSYNRRIQIFRARPVGAKSGTLDEKNRLGNASASGLSSERGLP